MLPSSSRSMRSAALSLGQPRHRHHVAGQRHHETGAGGQAHLADVDHVAVDRTALAGSVPKLYGVLAMHTDSAPWPSRCSWSSRLRTA
jgi:hypothetical protein